MSNDKMSRTRFPLYYKCLHLPISSHGPSIADPFWKPFWIKWAGVSIISSWSMPTSAPFEVACVELELAFNVFISSNVRLAPLLLLVLLAILQLPFDKLLTVPLPAAAAAAAAAFVDWITLAWWDEAESSSLEAVPLVVAETYKGKNQDQNK